MGAEKTYVFVRVCQSARHSRSIFVLFQNCKLKAVRALGGSPAVKMRAGKILPQFAGCFVSSVPVKRRDAACLFLQYHFVLVPSRVCVCKGQIISDLHSAFASANACVWMCAFSRFSGAADSCESNKDDLVPVF